MLQFYDANMARFVNPELILHNSMRVKCWY